MEIKGQTLAPLRNPRDFTTLIPKSWATQGFTRLILCLPRTFVWVELEILSICLHLPVVMLRSLLGRVRLTTCAVNQLYLHNKSNSGAHQFYGSSTGHLLSTAHLRQEKNWCQL